MWRTVKLGDVCKIVNGSTPLRKEKKFWVDGNVSWFTIDDMREQGRDIFFTKQHVTQAAVNEKKVKLIPANSVLLCCTASIGEVAIARKEMATNQQFNSLTPTIAELCCDYLYYVATTLKSKLLQSSGTTTISFLSMTKLKEIEIPLPPLTEQERIVAKLDTVFAEIDEAIALVDKQIQENHNFFISAVESRFKNKKDWKEKTLQEICEKITDGTHQTPKYVEDGYIFLSSKNVTSRKIDWTNIKYVDEEQHFAMQKRLSPKVGDILLAKNGTTGVAAMVDRDVEFDIYVSLAWLRSKGEVTPQYLLQFINSNAAKAQFSKRLKGVGVPNLHLKEIREVKICFPSSISKQNEVTTLIDKIDSLYQYRDSVLREKKENLYGLKSATLAQELQSSVAA